MKKKNFMLFQALLILSEIDKCGSQRKASEQLGMSIDTINKYISILEEEIGCKLLIGHSRGVILTISGKNLIRHVSDIENIFNQIYNEQPSKGKLKGDVLVSMPLSVSTNLLPRCIDDLFSTYPDINLVTRLYMDNTDFSTMDADIGLTFLAPKNNDAVILYKRQIPCGYFASPEYLAQHGYPKDFDDLLNNHWLITRVQLQNFLQEWKHVIKEAKHIRYITNSTYAATEIVRYGGGIAIMPMRFAKEGFVCLDNLKCETAPTIYLVGNKKSKDLPRVRVVINFYKKLIDNM
ncbi:MAG: LysR family transcriptional regulator [Rhodospirillales bacterium]|nr:LysR family transcriptional regulator [Rhodospirillales bacterium]